MQTRNDSKDEELVSNYIKHSDQDSLEVLVKRYLPLIYGYTRNYTGDADKASDITQEVFVKVWKNIHKFNPRKAAFKSWIFTIAKRTSIDWLRQKQLLSLNGLEETLVDDSSSILSQLLQKDSARDLEMALAKLPTNQSSIINLHINDGLSFKEIAHSFKESINTVKSRYRRGLRNLRNLLS